MKQAIHIFKKDARRLWPLIGLGLVLDLAFAILSLTGSDTDLGHSQSRGLLLMLLPLSWAFLIGAVVHGETLVDDKEFWLTRPYSRRSLLGSKLLFAACFISLPLLATHIGLLAASGFPISKHVVDLLWAQVMVGALFLAMLFAAASITSGFQQFMLASLSLIIADTIFPNFMFLIIRMGGIYWVSIWTKAIMALAVGALVTVSMYLRRSGVSFGLTVFISGALTTILLYPLVPWSVAYAMQQAFSPTTPDSSVIRFEPELDRKAPWGGHVYKNEARTFSIPVRVQTQETISFDVTRLVVQLRTPNDTKGVEAWGTALDYDSQQKQHRVRFSLNDYDFQRFKNVAAIDMVAHFSLFGNRTTRRTPFTAKRIELPNGDGECHMITSYDTRRPFRAGCLLVFKTPPRAMLRIERKDTGWSSEERRLGPIIFPPFLHTISASPLVWVTPASFEGAPGPDSTRLDEYEFVVDNWEPQGYAQKQLQIATIRLADYELK